MSDSISVYVGTYAKYNNGSIAGKWIDLEDHSDLESFYDECKELHKDENDPEFMFQDREGTGHDVFVSESGINELVFDFLDLDENNKLKVEYLVDHGGNSVKHAMENYENLHVIHCEYENEAADAYYDDLVEMGIIDESQLGDVAYYIDKEAMYRNDGNDFSFVSGLGLVSHN